MEDTEEVEVDTEEVAMEEDTVEVAMDTEEVAMEDMVEVVIEDMEEVAMDMAVEHSTAAAVAVGVGEIGAGVTDTGGLSIIL